MTTGIITSLAIFIAFGLFGYIIGIYFQKGSSPSETKRVSRKKRDTTKLTQGHYDFIVRARKDWEEYNSMNPKEKLSVQDLTDRINEVMGTDKSSRALGRVWSGEIAREDLPVGNRTFDY